MTPWEIAALIFALLTLARLAHNVGRGAAALQQIARAQTSEVGMREGDRDLRDRLAEKLGREAKP